MRLPKSDVCNRPEADDLEWQARHKPSNVSSSTHVSGKDAADMNFDIVSAKQSGAFGTSPCAPLRLHELVVESRTRIRSTDRS